MIYNGGTISSITGDFIGNSSSSSSSNSYGGAFSNSDGTISSITGDFIGNYSSSSSNNSSGGAIFNSSHTSKASIGSITGDFISNYAKTSSTTKKAYGGAIFNGYQTSGTPQYSGAQITLAGNTFTGNYVQDKDGTRPNSIYNAGVINIANGATVTIHDGYDGLAQAQLNIGTDSIFNLSVDNGEPQTDNLGTVINNGTINWDLDVDILANTSDNITATFQSGSTQSIIIRSINLLSDKEGESTVTFSGGPIATYVLDSTLAEHGFIHGDYAYTVSYNNGTGVLTFNGSEVPFVSGGATIDDVRVESEAYLKLASGSHGTYSDLVTTKDATHPDVVVINGTVYYFKADESLYDNANTAKVRNLAATGASALKEVTDSDNWIFKVDNGDSTYSYYTYNKKQLPVSVWNPTDGTSGNYDYITYTKNSSGDFTPKYKLINIRTNNMSSSSSVTWTASAGPESDMTWTDANHAKGTIKVTLPHNGATQDSYYTYTYTVPSGYTPVKDYTVDITASTAGASSDFRVNGGAVINNPNGTSYGDINNVVYANNTLNGVSTAYYNLIGGSVILNQGTIGDVVADFVGNNTITDATIADCWSLYSMGAIVNYAKTSESVASINSIVGNFIGNKIDATRSSYGGAIYNKAAGSNSSAIIGSIVGDFVGNSISSSYSYGFSQSFGSTYGGAIYNDDGTIGSITGDFISNRATSSYYNSQGGAIYNYDGTIGSITGDFVGNYASSSSGSSGGAIYNGQTISSITGDFVGNYASSSSSFNAYGGAISNEGTISSITGDFIGNSANSSSGDAYGGAIYNSTATIGSITGDFINNSANIGSAIYNNYSGSGGYGYATICRLTADFISNTAAEQGGAIWNGSFVNIVADTQDINFYNNTANGAYNDVYQTATDYGDSKLALNADSGKKIIFNGTIIGEAHEGYDEDSNPKYYYGNIDINKPTFTYNDITEDRPTGGQYVFNNKVSGNNIYLYNGANLKFGTVEQENGSTTYGSFDLTDIEGTLQNDANGGLIDIQNTVIDTNKVTNLVLNSAISLAIDTDLLAQTADTISASGTISAAAESLVISSINMLNDKEGTTTVFLTDNAAIMTAYTLSSAINDNIYSPGGYDYTVTYNNSTGVLTFNREVPFIPGDATIDKIYTKSGEYLALAKGSHGTYTNLVTTKDATHPDVVVINGTTYYFKAAESTTALTDDVRNLAATGASAIKEVGSGDNWIFQVGDKYYTYTAKSLPKSAYTITAYNTEPTSWNWTDGTKYYKLNFPGDKKRVNAYTYLSDSGEGAQGYLTVKLPHEGNRTV